MADNIEVTAGSGTTIATEDVSGVQHQKVKVEFGGDGVATLVSSTNPMPVQLGDGTDLATVRDVTGAKSLDVSIVDGSGNQITTFGGGTQYTEGDTDASITGTAMMMEGAANALVVAQGTAADGLLVNLGTNNDVTVTSGAITETNSAAIKTAVETLDNAIAGSEMQVDVVGALPAGTNNIGDVDVLSIVPGTGATNLGKAEDSVHASGDVGVMSLAVANEAQTVLTADGDYTPIAVNTKGQVYVANSVLAGSAIPVTQSGTWDEVGINDSGNSITVDYATTGSGTSTGALRVELPTNGTGVVGLNAGTNNIGDVDVASIAAGDNNIGNVDIVTMPNVTIGSALPAGTNAIGKLSANSGVDIGDVDVTSVIPGSGATNLGKAEDAAHASGDVGVASLARRIDTLATSADTSGDYAVENQTAEGALWATLAPTTTSGLSVANFTSGDTYTALTNTAQVIKASAGLFYGYYIYNPNSSATYVMVYNIAAASVTVGTSTPLLVFCIPATSGANLALPYGITFSNAGWSIAAATTGGGNTAPSTALEAMIFYK